LEQIKVKQNSAIKNSGNASCCPAFLKLNKNYLFHQLYLAVHKPGSFFGGKRKIKCMLTKIAIKVYRDQINVAGEEYKTL
jgi:hypothetical protein